MKHRWACAFRAGMGVNNINHGAGGGGGGVLFDGSGPNATNGAEVSYKGYGGIGYGAGGGGGGEPGNQGGISQIGGNGAPGFVYLEWG